MCKFCCSIVEVEGERNSCSEYADGTMRNVTPNAAATPNSDNDVLLKVTLRVSIHSAQAFNTADLLTTVASNDAPLDELLLMCLLLPL